MKLRPVPPSLHPQGTYIACAVLAGTFLLVWIVLASTNRLVYDNAAADEDKHGFGNRATHAWETTCAGSLSGWFCALLLLLCGGASTVR